MPLTQALDGELLLMIIDGIQHHRRQTFRTIGNRPRKLFRHAQPAGQRRSHRLYIDGLFFNGGRGEDIGQQGIEGLHLIIGQHSRAPEQQPALLLNIAQTWQ